VEARYVAGRGISGARAGQSLAGHLLAGLVVAGLGTASPTRYVPGGAGSAYRVPRVEDISALGGENGDIREETQELFRTVRHRRKSGNSDCQK